MSDCPSTAILKQFAAATLPDAQAEELLVHLDTCPACAERLDALAKLPNEKIVAGFRKLRDKNIDASSSLPSRIGRYDILEKIGQGGMGVVYRAVHPHLKREVALKVIRDSRLDDPDARERFLREMQSLGKLTHPNIVHATDASIDGDTPFIVTELLDGQDLSSYVMEHGKMPVKQAIDCLRQTATGLSYAHKAGYIHRDIKPSNLFLTRNGNIKILDLGITKRIGFEGDRSCTHEPGVSTPGRQVLGSPEFMAPEQFRGGTVDARSDIYSLGQTFAHLLAGEGEPIPPRLQAILTRMTAGLPEQRFQTVDELLKAIDALTANESFKRNMILTATGAAVLIIVALVALRDSSGDTEIIAEPPPVSATEIHEAVKVEPRHDVQHEREKPQGAATIPAAGLIITMEPSQEKASPGDGHNSGLKPREFTIRSQPYRTVNENFGLDPYGRPLSNNSYNNNASNQYGPVVPPPAALRTCSVCNGTGRNSFLCGFCQGSGLTKGTNFACSLCKGLRFEPCPNCKGTGKR